MDDCHVKTRFNVSIPGSVKKTKQTETRHLTPVKTNPGPPEHRVYAWGSESLRPEGVCGICITHIKRCYHVNFLEMTAVLHVVIFQIRNG